jgi:hypothetical protein
MHVRQLSASLLLALLWPNTPAQPLRLQHFTPVTMRPVGAPLKLDYSWFNGNQSLAWANGWFVARSGGTVDAIDLQTARVTSHRPRRALAKGRSVSEASWLGEHRLGLSGTVVDVRTWRKRTIALGADRLDAVGGYVIARGKNGITVFDDSLRLYRRFARGRVIDRIGLSDGVLSAQIGLAWDRWNLRTAKHLGIVLPDTPWLVQLLD